MKIITTDILTKPQKDTIIYLWNREYPRQLAITPDGFETYLQSTSAHSHFLILDDANEIIGWAYTFDRDDQRWFSIMIDSLYQRLGLGHKLLNLLKEKESRLNGWVIDRADNLKHNGSLYESPLPFYLKNGFIVCPETRYEEKQLSAVKIEWNK
jgi:GNAT superfamily N-acetyltransferase